jgi:16S rRNA (adenine1518-N6/adenine1519-N6)-dimethyltransferase
VIGKIIDVAGLDEDDIVLEIGPGLGALTIPLAGKVRHLIAIELDNELCQKLKNIFSDTPHVQVVQGDALQIDYEKLIPAKKMKVVANLPYYLAIPILLRLLEVRRLFSEMTLMFQKEVAVRIVAKPGGKDYGLLSVSCQLFSDVTWCFTIPPQAFKPPPQIDSAVLKFKVLENPKFQLKDLNHFFELVKCVFSQRRKTLRNTLKSHLNVIHSTQLLDKALAELNIDPYLRGEALSTERYVQLSNYLVSGHGVWSTKRGAWSMEQEARDTPGSRPQVPHPVLHAPHSVLDDRI